MPVKYLRILPKYGSVYRILIKERSAFEFTKKRPGPKFNVGRVPTPKTEAGGWFMRDSAPGTNRGRSAFCIVRYAPHRTKARDSSGSPAFSEHGIIRSMEALDQTRDAFLSQPVSHGLGPRRRKFSHGVWYVLYSASPTVSENRANLSKKQLEIYSSKLTLANGHSLK